MGSGPTAGRRQRRRLLEIAFVLVTIFAAGLVTAGVVSGAGPLAVLSTDETSTATETTTTDTTSTDPTSTETTSTEPTTSDPTDTTATETTTTDTTPTDTTPAWPEATEPYLVKFASGTSGSQQSTALNGVGATVNRSIASYS